MSLFNRADRLVTALPLLGLASALLSPAALAQTASSGHFAPKTTTPNRAIHACAIPKQEANHRGVEIAVGSSPEEGTKPLGILTGDSVSYNGKERIATITGNVTLRLKDRTVSGDRGVYDGRSQTVTVTGNVSVVSSQGDKIVGSKVMFALKQGTEATSLEEGINAFPETQEGTRVASATQSTGSAAASGL